MDTKNQNHSELTNEEYFKAVLDLQPEVIASVNKKLSEKAIKLAEADYRKWVLKCRKHKERACWDSACPGELEFVLEYKPAQEKGASIVTARCEACGNEYRFQDYEENLKGMKSRLNYALSNSEENIKYKAEEIKSLKKKLEETRDEKNALHLKHVLNVQLRKELGAN